MPILRPAGIKEGEQRDYNKLLEGTLQGPGSCISGCFTIVSMSSLAAGTRQLDRRMVSHGMESRGEENCCKRAFGMVFFEPTLVLVKPRNLLKSHYEARAGQLVTSMMYIKQQRNVVFREDTFI